MLSFHSNRGKCLVLDTVYTKFKYFSTKKYLFWDQINFNGELMRLWRKQRDFLDSKVIIGIFKWIDHLKSRKKRDRGIEDFLELSEEEHADIELKVELSEMVIDIHERKGLTQIRAAKLIKSSQSRLSKIESADTLVSIDLEIYV
jgi:predicted XRE-type DNA-binding protein